MDNTNRRQPDPTGSTDAAAAAAYEAAIERGETNNAAFKIAVAEFPSSAAFIADYSLSLEAAKWIETDEQFAAAEARIASRGAAILAARFAPTAAPLRGGVIEAAKSAGYTLATLAQALGLARSVLVKLDRRLIDAATVPVAVVERIAGALGATAPELRAYLLLAPTLGASASYKAQSTPTIEGEGARQSFAGALNAAVQSGEMSAGDAQAWSGGDIPPNGA